MTVPNGGGTTQAGTYVDAITGEKWTVTSESMSGRIGSTGISVLYKEGTLPENPDEPDDRQRRRPFIMRIRTTGAMFTLTTGAIKTNI